MKTRMLGWVAAALIGWLPLSVHAQSCTLTPPANSTHGTCPSNNSLPSGDSCTFACDAGYVLNGSNYSCTSGVLTGGETCTPAACVVTTPADGTLGTCPSDLASGGSCQFTCDTGYTLNGAATSCSFGTLTAQTCTASSCTVTAPINGYLGTCSSTLASGASCQFTCDAGYTLVGSQTTCSDGSLSAQTCVLQQPTGGDTSGSGPLPWWAVGALAVSLVLVSWRKKRAT